MGMTISERMAMQARAAAASHVNPIISAKTTATVSAAARAAKQASVVQSTRGPSGAGAPPDAKTTGNSMGAMERIARQGSVARQNSAAAAHIAPPPAEKTAATLSASERIHKQALTAAAQARGSTKADVNEQVLADIRARYAVYLANIDKEIAASGPLYFVPGQPQGDTVETVADNANGISTAEGTMVMEAEPSEPVPNMPYQATPVIIPEQPKRKPRRKKADTAD